MNMKGVLNMDDKIKALGKLTSDLDYLRDEYESIRIWGSCPDGDVTFNKFMDWLGDNEHLVEHMTEVAVKLKDIQGIK